MEMKVHALVEACAEAAAGGDTVMALERAKEAGRKERALVKFRDSNSLSDSINMDLTYCCAFNLAQAYHLNKMYAEALNTYALIVKNKQYPHAGRLRINMGNIYYEEKNYPQALKMYRMALDQLGGTSRDLRTRIQRNIGHAAVRMAQFQDAIAAFEAIMDAAPEMQAGFDLLVCYYALGDVELMKKGFQRLLGVPLPEPDEAEEDRDEDDDGDEEAAAARLELARDPLKEELRSRQKAALAFVTNAAKLIAPMLEPADWQAGYDWVIDQLKRDHASVASEMQISKALEFMRHKDFDRAIEDLKAFEKKDVRLKARAATNLSFLYFLEGVRNSCRYFVLVVAAPHLLTTTPYPPVAGHGASRQVRQPGGAARPVQRQGAGEHGQLPDGARRPGARQGAVPGGDRRGGGLRGGDLQPGPGEQAAGHHGGGAAGV